ncbi:hypothetical protein MDA_GLEAN10019412 [Myotis davidii]|uniref:Uncharacterized protein n=1 Tax=Myotis davidii TaxID=225400 RepID=L5LX54_MYODS|nr:hypothetical protein MDA_GLEAN10019412 [Myotis davidii]
MLVVTSSWETPGMDRGHRIAERHNKPLPFTKWAQHSRGNAVLTAHAPAGVRAAFAVWPELDEHQGLSSGLTTKGPRNCVTRAELPGEECAVVVKSLGGCRRATEVHSRKASGRFQCSSAWPQVNGKFQSELAPSVPQMQPQTSRSLS